MVKADIKHRDQPNPHFIDEDAENETFNSFGELIPFS